MKIKSGLISHQVGEQYVTVTSEESGKAFNGILRSNKIVVDILSMLEQEISEEELVDQLYDRYDARREQISSDVHKIIAKIREVGLLDE